jgi:S-adenosylmethionine:tRNA ribosyltransferase-isomerase
MKVSLFDYQLPKELIAQKPASPRDSSKLLLIERDSKKISHHSFKDIANLLKKDDILVFNKTKVFPARIFVKKETGGKIEILFLEEISPKIWKVLTKPSIKPNQKLFFRKEEFVCIKQNQEETLIKTKLAKNKLLSLLEKFGKTPLPPYIKIEEKESYLRKKYQTVYAKETGSSAAPTAGFHFTKRLLEKLKRKGVKTEFVTLHIGLGTFKPIKTENLEDHKIHSEEFEIEKEVLERLIKAKKEGKRIIAVGTTTTRVLETIALNQHKLKGKTNLFIYPPFKFKMVDGLITNFHLPHSTLLALVCAFVSHPQTKENFKDFQTSLIGKAYKEAISKNYRFYSFGDACFII